MAIASMHQMLSKILFFIISLAYSFKYDHLRILIVQPSHLPPLPQIESGLFAAIDDLSSKITVLREPLIFLDPRTLQKCVQNNETLLKAIDTNGRSVEVNSVDGIPLHGYNFVLSIERNSGDCQTDAKTLATAKPCEPVPNQRPLIGLLNICVDRRWDHFGSAKDLFRHEILHSLGYGTFTTTELAQRSPPPEGYNWFDGYKKQKAVRHFMDFSQKSLKTVREHFNCPQMRGIEADGDEKFHLNEYIFGNELMTPRLSNGLNPFSWISASILEETFNGPIQWYVVNKTAITEENSKYWYGRGWGCNFTLSSCHTVAGWPFCHGATLRNGVITYCVKKTYGPVQRFQSKCMKSPLKNERAQDNGVVATPLVGMKGLTGEPTVSRFCPIAKDVFDNKIEASPGIQVFPC